MTRPLSGRRVLVARATGQSGRAADLLREAGAEPVVVPVLVVTPPSDPAPLARAMVDLAAGAYAWVAFTSANGVERTLAAAAPGAEAFTGVRIGAVGPATANACSAHGLRVDVVARELRGEGLAAELLRAMGGTPARVLLPRAAKARSALPDALRDAGWTVDEVVAYETHAPPPGALAAVAADLEAGRLDAVLFTSSSTVDHLCDALGDRAPELLARARIASIGPLTTATAEARGLRVAVTAAESTVPGLIDALASSYSSRGPETVA